MCNINYRIKAVLHACVVKKNRMLRTCGIDAHGHLSRLLTTLSPVLWSTVHRSLVASLYQSRSALYVLICPYWFMVFAPWNQLSFTACPNAFIEVTLKIFTFFDRMVAKKEHNITFTFQEFKTQADVCFPCCWTNSYKSSSHWWIKHVDNSCILIIIATEFILCGEERESIGSIIIQLYDQVLRHSNGTTTTVVWMALL